MREILFRGKRIDNGEWVYGDLINNHDGRKFVGKVVVDDYKGTANDTYEVGIGFVEVDPSTVGQYTGLTDKNDKRIFEGDIVRNHNGQIYEMVFIEKYNCYYFVRESSVYAGIKPKDIEVIGNIHDNPELLEVRE